MAIEYTALAVLVAYFVATLAIGYVAFRRTENTPTDYFLANRSFGTAVLMFTVLATIFSAFLFFGVGAMTYATGTGVATVFLLGTGAQVFVMYMVGSPFRRVAKKKSQVSPTEYLEGRFESHVPSVLYTLFAVLFVVPFIASQILAGGIALDILVGIPRDVAIVVLTAIMAAYIVLGGLRAAAWTDVLQGMVLLGALVAGFGLLVVTFGPTQLTERVLASSPQAFEMPGPRGAWNVRMLVSWMVFFPLGPIFFPWMLQRWMAAKSDRVLRTATVWWGLLAMGVAFLAVIIGAWARGLLTQVPNPDYIVPLVFDSLFPPIVAAVILAGAVAALQSSAGSFVLGLGGVISRQFYVGYLAPEASADRESTVLKGIVFVLFVASGAIALRPPAGIFSLGANAIAGFATFAPAFIGGLYWRRTTAPAAAASMLVGATTVLVYFYGVVPRTLSFGFHEGFLGVVAATVVLVVGSVVTSTPSETAVRSFTSTWAAAGEDD